MDKTPDRTRWTAEKATAFLKALAQHGKVAPAARSVGMSRQAAYRLRVRAPKFAEFWDMAMRDAARTKAVARRARKHVHPLLAPNPLPDRAVTQVPPQGDTLARRASRIAAARSQMARPR